MDNRIDHFLGPFCSGTKSTPPRLQLEHFNSRFVMSQSALWTGCVTSACVA